MIKYDVSLLHTDEELSCAYAGQRAKLWKIYNDGVASLELSCGHPYTISISYIEIMADSPAANKLKEFKMAKAKAKATTAVATATKSTAAKRKVAGAVSKVPMMGFELQVISLRQKLSALDWMKKEADELKDELREAAKAAGMASDADITTFSFEDGKGNNVSVSLPDTEAAGNRTSVKAAVLSSLEEQGLETEELLETTRTYLLEDEFVIWLDALLAQWEEQGVAVPAGLTEKVMTRLTAEGATHLKELAKGGDEVAMSALSSFVKAPMVRASK